MKHGIRVLSAQAYGKSCKLPLISSSVLKEELDFGFVLFIVQTS